jgi:uncharacterized protein YndB with AHSA1/START domain
VNSRLATFEESDGVCRLRFSRVFPVSAAQVWQAITEPNRLAAWFPQRVEYLSWDGEPRAGAGVRFRMPGDRRDVFAGEVLVCDPAAVLELRWGTDLLRFELDAEGSETLLMLSDTFTEKGKAARDAAGWHVCLDALEHALGEDLVPGAWAAHFEEYARRFGADAATLRPVTT